MYAIKPTDRQWIAAKQTGVERCVLWEQAGGGRTALIRMAQGARIEAHDHLGREEVLVLSGRLRLGGFELGEGDYHHTGPGERHEVEALEDCVFHAMTEKVIAGR